MYPISNFQLYWLFFNQQIVFGNISELKETNEPFAPCPSLFFYHYKQQVEIKEGLICNVLLEINVYVL